MKKTIPFFVLAILFMVGCTSTRTSHVYTKLQTYEIDEAIKDGSTTKRDVAKRFGNQCTIEQDEDGREMWVYRLAISIPTAVKKTDRKVEFGGVNYNHYQNPRYTNQTHFASKYEGFSPEFETKNYTFTLFFDEKGTVISHHLLPSEGNKLPDWESFNPSLQHHHE